MYYRALMLVFIVFASNRTNASEIPIVKKNSPYISYLLDHPSAHFKLYDYSNVLLSNSSRLNEVSFIVSKEGIIYKPIGTGYLFEIKKSGLDSQVTVSRIDSTYYTGYNFLDYLFKRNDTIFSIGGEGFWSHNGQLRYFAKDKKEWDLVPIQQWFPISGNDIVDIKTDSGRIYTYFLENKYSTVFTNQKGNIIDSAIMFDLKNGVANNIGSLLPNIKLLNISGIIKIGTDYGVLIVNNGEVKLLDFENNKFSEWKNIQLNNLFNSSKAEIKPLIIRDSVLFYFNIDKLDSIVLPISQFTLISKIYNPIDSKSESRIIFQSIFSVLIIIGLVLFIYIIRRRNRLKPKNQVIEIVEQLESNINNENIVKLNTILDLNEIQLLAQILSHNNKISVEQLNYILGLDKKNMQVQKKNRSSIISSINIKFKSEYSLPDELIQRIKDENDARNIIYQINLKYFDLIMNWHKIASLK